MTCPLNYSVVTAVVQLLSQDPPLSVAEIARRAGVDRKSVRNIRDKRLRYEQAHGLPVSADADSLGLDLTPQQLREVERLRAGKRLGRAAEPVDSGEFRQQDEIRNIY